MRSPLDIREQFENNGHVWLRGAVTPTELAQLEQELACNGRPGARLSLNGPSGMAVKRLAFVEQIAQIWPGMRPVRMVNFDKCTGTNWSVPWHQDRVISVDRRADLEGYVNWSRKSEVWHCEPPLDLLARMLFVRLHLDASSGANGAMEIACGSHEAGKVMTGDAGQVARAYKTEITEAEPGDVLVLRMLTLHRSLPSKSGASRRALRIDFAAGYPDEALGWAE